MQSRDANRRARSPVEELSQVGWLEPRVAGPPAQCVDTSTTLSGPVIADTDIITINAGKRIWRAKVRGQCAQIQPFNTLIVDRWGSQLCRNDRFRVVQQGMSIPSQWCFFDGFVPYDRVTK